MHSNSIVSSNLLDIIFENRNKDYGAYVLRKNYNKRLFISLVSVLVLVVIFSFWQMLIRKNPTAGLTAVQFVPDPSISSSRQFEQIEPKKIIHSQGKTAGVLNAKPVIVKNAGVSKVPPTNQLILASNVGNINEGPPVEETGPGGPGTGGEGITEPAKSSLPAVNRNIPDISPEILPQFPGGMSELIKFLRHNLNTPRELAEGEDISVKVKFIVSFNGDIMGFNVVETGGEPFDNEVIRVLKKMPKWIPGKARGENVSAYFIIPVKFTVSN